MSIRDGFTIYVDSHNKLCPTDNDSNFSYAILFPPNKTYDRAVVLNAIIPKSYYLINQYNNVFYLTENSVTVAVPITNGDYLLPTWKLTLKTQLNALSPNHWTYDVISPNPLTEPNTGKLTFTVTGNGGSQPSITVDNPIFEQLGFAANSTNNFVNNTLTSTNVIKLQVEDRVLINSDIVIGETLNKGGVLQEINASPSPDFSTIVYQCTAPEYYSKPLNFGKSIYNFSFTNEDGQLLDFNGVNVNFTLFIYKSNDVYDRIKNYIRFNLLDQENKK